MLKPQMLIQIVPAACAPAQKLMDALNADLKARYPGEQIHTIDSDGFEAAGGLFAVGRYAEEAVCCGALRPFADGVGEIKRMYVIAQKRRCGLAAAMLAFLEKMAAGRGYTRLVLECGTEQPEALAFYRNQGWLTMLPYGDFAADARSVCFTKILRHSCAKEA